MPCLEEGGAPENHEGNLIYWNRSILVIRPRGPVSQWEQEVTNFDVMMMMTMAVQYRKSGIDRPIYSAEIETKRGRPTKTEVGF